MRTVSKPLVSMVVLVIMQIILISTPHCVLAGSWKTNTDGSMICKGLTPCRCPTGGYDCKPGEMVAINKTIHPGGKSPDAWKRILERGYIDINPVFSAGFAGGDLEDALYRVVGNVTFSNLSNDITNKTILTVQEGKIFEIAGPHKLLNAGVLSGSGTIKADVVNSYAVSPGESAGILSIDGRFLNAQFGSVVIELGGVIPGKEYDQLRILGADGTATLGGVLQVDLLGGFKPRKGDAFEIISTTGGIRGDFEEFILPDSLSQGWKHNIRDNKYYLVYEPPTSGWMILLIVVLIIIIVLLILRKLRRS